MPRRSLDRKHKFSLSTGESTGAYNEFLMKFRRENQGKRPAPFSSAFSSAPECIATDTTKRRGLWCTKLETSDARNGRTTNRARDRHRFRLPARSPFCLHSFRAQRRRSKSMVLRRQCRCSRAPARISMDPRSIGLLRPFGVENCPKMPARPVHFYKCIELQWPLKLPIGSLISRLICRVLNYSRGFNRAPSMTQHNAAHDRLSTLKTNRIKHVFYRNKYHKNRH